jgi:hypothetical protein
MSDFLVTHAITNVWCTPDQDRQVVFAPARISINGGVRGVVPVLWDSLALPTPNDVYHVYQIGQVKPALLDLLPTMGVWSMVAENMKDNNLIADVYTIDGLQLPRIETYILVNFDRNILVAIKDQLPVVNLCLPGQQLFLRLYSNAYFESARERGGGDYIDIYGARITSTAQTLSLQRKYQALQQLKGLVCAYIDGRYVDAFNPATVAAGSVVEFVYDSTVKRVVEFPVADLQTFTSLRDGKFKYLLHYSATGEHIIDYIDDIDVYLINRKVPGPVPAFNGVYYHKNNPDAMRMVTHKDYSVVVPYIVAYADATPGWGNIADLTVRLHIRNSGYARPLINEASRISDLYKLPDTAVVQAMVGTNSTCAVWQAANLENAGYPLLMDAPTANDITLDLVQEAYGYDAIAKLLADSPITATPVGTIITAPLPYGLSANATIYEYDVNGYLLGWYRNAVGSEYRVNNANCTLIEGIVGIAGPTLSTSHSVTPYTIDPTKGYRYYTAPLNSGELTGPWTDVTGNNTDYVIHNNQVMWLVDPASVATMVRDDINFLAYTYTMTPGDGLLKFSITSTEVYSTGPVNAPMAVPVGQLDLWLNNRPIIEGLDYYVNWPEVCIVNKEYLIANPDGSIGAQVITVRGTGFCNSDLSRNVATDVGFVEYGVLSRNNRFNVRDDKVLRIVVNGALYPRSALEFSEDNPSVGMSIVPNGSPYAITDVVVPLRGITDIDTYALRAIDVATDTSIENYLSLQLTDPVEVNPDEVPDLYQIYSPFCAKVMYDLIAGDISMADFMGQYSDMDVKNALAGYTYLLQYEPTEKSLDLSHIVIEPHNRQTVVVLNIYQYNFLKRAVTVILNNLVDLSQSVAILPTYI